MTSRRAVLMGVFSPGFLGRRRERDPRLPPGQHAVTNFPVLSAGPIPNVRLDRWTFGITNERNQTTGYTWEQFQKLPTEDVTVDLHCVTRWSQFDMPWRGVSLDLLLEGVETTASFAVARSYGGYTTNIPLDELRGGKAWIATRYDGKPLSDSHGGPARLLVPHLYLWKSAKWINRVTLHAHDQPGFWETNGYNNHGDPWREERYW